MLQRHSLPKTAVNEPLSCKAVTGTGWQAALAVGQHLSDSPQLPGRVMLILACPGLSSAEMDRGKPAVPAPAGNGHPRPAAVRAAQRKPAPLPGALQVRGR